MDSKETNEQQQQQQPPHGTLTGSYNHNAAALMGSTSTSPAMHQWLPIDGDPSLRQPQQPLGLGGSPSSVATQQPWMQFENEQRPRGRGRGRGRGRPRKYASDVIDLSLRLSYSPAGDGGGGASANSSDPPVKRTRGRPPGPAKSQPLGGAGTPVNPDIILVEAGEDIAAKIVAYTHQGGPREVVILSASGAVSSALLQCNKSSGLVEYEGLYEIVAMSGSFLNNESDGTLTITTDMNVYLANQNGNIVGGYVAEMLVAGSQVQVVVGNYVPERVDLRAGRVENNPEPASATHWLAVSGGGPESPQPQGPLHQVGNSTPQPPDQMCDLHLWPGSNPQ